MKIKLLIPLFFSLFTANSFAFLNNDNVKVCANTQMYFALNAIKDIAPYKFEPFFATTSELYAMIANNTKKCDILISSEEKIAIELIRSNRIKAQSLQPFLRAPLILWSKNPLLFKNNSPLNIETSKLKSIAIAKAELTPVGFATNQIVSSDKFKTNYLKDKIYRADHEYQVFSMVSSENVQAGFITKPLIIKNTRESNGSYWVVPKSYHADILYYISMHTNSVKQKEVIALYNYLYKNSKAIQYFKAFGFEDINSTRNINERSLN